MASHHINVFKKYQNEAWYLPISEHVTKRYSEIERNFLETFPMVTPDTSNRNTHSPVFSRIIKDVASTFGSIIQEFIKCSSESYEDSISGYLKLVKECDPDIENRSVLFRFNGKTLLPFKKSSKDDPIPTWWHACNKLKHEEIAYCQKGNLENALNAIAALAILGKIISPSFFVSTSMFSNLGIAYPVTAIDVSNERLLFP